MKSIILIIWFVFSCSFNTSLTLKGKIGKPMMAIGGETTGVVLVLQKGETIELMYDGELEEGEELTVKGHYIELTGPERGARKVFKVEQVIKDY